MVLDCCRKKKKRTGRSDFIIDEAEVDEDADEDEDAYEVSIRIRTMALQLVGFHQDSLTKMLYILIELSVQDRFIKVPSARFTYTIIY